MPYIAVTEHHRLTLYDLDECAKLLGVCRRTMWQYVRDAKLPANKIGGQWLISEENIVKYYHGAQMVDDLGNDLPRRNRKKKINPPKYAQFKPVPIKEAQEICGYDADLQSPYYVKHGEEAAEYSQNRR